MGVARRLPNYRLNHGVRLASCAVTAMPRQKDKSEPVTRPNRKRKRSESMAVGPVVVVALRSPASPLNPEIRRTSFVLIATRKAKPSLAEIFREVCYIMRAYKNAYLWDIV